MMALWKTYNPDPALIKGSQWGHWHPSHMQQPQQLKSLVADGGWMAAPGVMLSVSLRRFSSRTEVETKNSFSALHGARAHDGFHSAGAATAGADEDLTKEITWFHSLRRLSSWVFWPS